MLLKSLYLKLNPGWLPCMIPPATSQHGNCWDERCQWKLRQNQSRLLVGWTLKFLTPSVLRVVNLNIVRWCIIMGASLSKQCIAYLISWHTSHGCHMKGHLPDHRFESLPELVSPPSPDKIVMYGPA